MKKRSVVLRKAGYPVLFRAIAHDVANIFSRRTLMRTAMRGARVLMVLCMALSCAGAAPARTLTIQSFKAEITVTPDGMVDVTETIQAHFAGAWNGLYRTVPIQYTTPQGLNYSLFVTPVSATDDSGNALKYETSSANGYLKFKIYVPDAVDATRTIVLHYRVSDALTFFEDHDELYWNITGNDWDEPVGNVSAVITLPAGTTGLHALAFTGTYGSKSEDARVQTLGTLVEVQMRRTLEFHEGVSVVVGWDKGFVRARTKTEIALRFLRSNWPFVIPIITLFVMFWLWYLKGRDPRRKSIAVQYDPPDGMTPGEVGTLVDNSAAMRDIIATLVDLAVRGYLTIEEKQTSQAMGLIHHSEYTFHLKKKASEWTGLKQHELQLLSALFTEGAVDTVSLSELQNHFYKNIPGIRDSLFDELLERGYYLHRPDYVRAGWIGGALVVGFLFFATGMWTSFAMRQAPTALIVSAILTGLIICVFGWFMPGHTAKGMTALENTLGFEDFLQHVESDRIARIEKTPALFEKYLPFAMALGVEKNWVGAFGDICKQPPSWYQGGVYGNGFMPLYFVASLNSMSAQTASVMSSAPRSAGGGSGFGGGGFSGGGFGGGGGGGF
jgi:uncharacterized membrane protein YgcG